LNAIKMKGARVMAKNKRAARRPQSPKPRSPKPRSFADLQRQIREEGRQHERLRRPLSPKTVARLKGPELPPHVVAERKLGRAERHWREGQGEGEETWGGGWTMG